MEYAIAFTFTVTDTVPLNVTLNFNGGNTISLTQSQTIQIQAVQGAITPLNSAVVSLSAITLQAAQPDGSSFQAVKSVVTIKPDGSNLTGVYQFHGNEFVTLQYQFIGYSNSGTIKAGSFSIPFPTD